MPLIMVNQNNQNVLLQQPLLVAEIFYVEPLPWDCWVEFHQERQKMEVAFQSVPMAEIMASVQVIHTEPDHMPSVKGEANQEPHPTFGPIPTSK